MPTLSMCFRNVIREVLEEFFKVFNYDTFLISLFGVNGGPSFLPISIQGCIMSTLAVSGQVWHR